MPALALRWKLTLAATAVLVAVLVVFGGVVYREQRTALFEQTARGLRLSVGAAVAEIANAPPGPAGKAKDPKRLPVPGNPSDPATPGGQGTAGAAVDPRRLRDLAKNLTTRDAPALTTNLEGVVLGNGPALRGEGGPAAPVLDAARYRAVVQANEEEHFRYETPAGPVVVELVPLVRVDATSDGQVVGVLQVSTSLAGVDDSLARLRRLLVVGTLSALLATVGLTAILVRGVLRPLRRVAAASRAIAGGDLGQRVVVPSGNDELTDMARAFNGMVGRLEAALTTQRRFLADVSHELRTPLTALGGGVEMLQLGADGGDPAKRERLLRLMDGETARMGRLVDDLLVLTRFDADPAGALHPVPVELGPLLDEVAESMRLLAPALTIGVERERADAVVAEVDPDRLRQALLNLCANARAHTPAGGTVTLALRRVVGGVEMAVADSGEGIAAEDLPRVWDRFFRTDPARTRRTNGDGLGLGLGLAIVRAVVEAHGGRVAIASTKEAGTTVTLTLPISARVFQPIPVPFARIAPVPA